MSKRKERIIVAIPELKLPTGTSTKRYAFIISKTKTAFHFYCASYPSANNVAELYGLENVTITAHGHLSLATDASNKRWFYVVVKSGSCRVVESFLTLLRQRQNNLYKTILHDARPKRKNIA